MSYNPNKKYSCKKCGYHHNPGSQKHQPHWKHRDDIEEESEEELEEEEIEELETLNREELREARREIGNEVKDLALEDIDGISDDVARKLKRVGVLLPSDLAQLEPKDLESILKEQGIKGIGPKTSERLIECAKDACGGGVRTAKQMIVKYKRRVRKENIITTGSKELDEKIGGGWIMGTTIEAYGMFASGKSELALALVVNSFLPADMGGLVRDDFIPQALIIDTEGVMDMAVSRFIEMCAHISEVLGHNQNEALDFLDLVTENIDIQQASSSAVQQKKMDKAYEDVLAGKKNYVIIIVDSLVNTFRQDYPKLNELAPRQKAINIFLKRAKDTITITKTPDNLGGILFCTNQAQQKPTIYGDGVTNIGGGVVQHNLDLRLKCRRPSQKKPDRVVKIVDSSWLPTGDAGFQILGKGVTGEDGETTLEKMIAERENEA